MRRDGTSTAWTGMPAKGENDEELDSLTLDVGDRLELD